MSWVGFVWEEVKLGALLGICPGLRFDAGSCPRSSIQILKDYPETEAYLTASFDVLELTDIPAMECYVCCAFRIVEVGPISGENGKAKRQLRVGSVDASSSAGGLASCAWYACSISFGALGDDFVNVAGGCPLCMVWGYHGITDKPISINQHCIC